MIAALTLLFAVQVVEDRGIEGGKDQVTRKAFKHDAACPKKCDTCQPALEKALKHLAGQLNSSGVRAGNGSDAVVTALAGLAFLANGSTPQAGPYAKQIEEIATVLLDRIGRQTSGAAANGSQGQGIWNWDLAFGARVSLVGEQLSVRTLTKDGPAAKGGFAIGDALVEVDGKAVKDVKAAREAVQALKAGIKVKFVVMRSGDRKTIEVTPAERYASASAEGEGEEL